MKKLKQLVIYQAKDGKIEFRGDFKRDTIWASQRQISQVFGVNLQTINEHLINIYKDGELQKKATIRNFRIVRKEGKRVVEREIAYSGSTR